MKSLGKSPERLIVLGFSLFLAALLSETVLLFHFVGATINSSGWVAHTHQVIAQLEILRGDVVDIETGTRGYVILGQPKLLEPYHNSLMKLDRDVRRLLALTADDPRQTERIKEVLPLIADKINDSQQVINVRQDQGFIAAQAMIATSQGQQMTEIRRLIGQMMDEEQRLLGERQAFDRQSAQHLQQIVTGLAILTALIALGISAAILYGLRLRNDMMHALDKIAHTDALTGLFNRRHLMIQASALLALTERKSRSAAMLFLDLDGFKAVNDTYGHDVGDELLRIVSQRLRISIRSSDLLARLGGDEFVVFLPEVETPQDAEAVARKIITSLAEPYLIGEIEAHVTASIGIAIAPTNGVDVETLLQHADMGLYEAKSSGKNGYVIYQNLRAE